MLRPVLPVNYGELEAIFHQALESLLPSGLWELVARTGCYIATIYCLHPCGFWGLEVKCKIHFSMMHREANPKNFVN